MELLQSRTCHVSLSLCGARSGCEQKMSQDCHTIKENKRSTVILVAVIKWQRAAECSAWMQLPSSWQLCQERWRSHRSAAEEAVNISRFHRFHLGFGILFAKPASLLQRGKFFLFFSLEVLEDCRYWEISQSFMPVVQLFNLKTKCCTNNVPLYNV